MSAVGQQPEGGDYAISGARTPATRTSSRAGRTKAADRDPEPPASSSSSSGPGSLLPSDPSWSSRVTRSRSRSLMRDTEDVTTVTRRVTVSRVPMLPRLDIQSEDEEELEEPGLNITEDVAEQSLLPTPSIPWPKIPREGRNLLLASLLLILLLLVINKVVESLHHDKNIHEAVIMVLAYALAPVRLTVEGARLVGGAVVGGAQGSGAQRPAQIDYDLLVDNILASDRFHSVLDKVSNEKISLLGMQMEERKRREDRELGDVVQSQINTMNTRIEDSKVLFQKEIEAAISNIKSDNTNKIQYENSQREVLTVLETQISESNLQIEELKARIANTGEKENHVMSENLTKIREELKNLEEGQQMTSAEIQKCCGDKSDINLVIENKVSGLVAQLKQDLTDKLVTEEQLNLRLMQVDSDNMNNYEYTTELVEETKAEIKELISSKVEDLKRDLSLDTMTSPGESNGTMDSSVDSGDVKRIVREALTKYDADKTGLFDFALETAGGSVLTTKCTEPYQMTSAVMSVWGIPFWWDTNTPRYCINAGFKLINRTQSRTILQPGTSPGQCWAFRGSHGVIVVQLSASIHITAVTIGEWESCIRE